MVVERFQKLRAPEAVSRPVVSGEGCGQDWPNDRRAAFGPGLITDFSETNQRNLRRINDAEQSFDSEIAEVRHGNCRVGQFRAAQTPSPRARADAITSRSKSKLFDKLSNGNVNARRPYKR